MVHRFAALPRAALCAEGREQIQQIVQLNAAIKIGIGRKRHNASLGCVIPCGSLATEIRRRRTRHLCHDEGGRQASQHDEDCSAHLYKILNSSEKLAHSHTQGRPFSLQSRLHQGQEGQDVTNCHRPRRRRSCHRRSLHFR